MPTVRAIVPFVGVVSGSVYHVTSGEEFELPDGADWIGAGFVVPVRPLPNKKKRTYKKRAAASK